MATVTEEPGVPLDMREQLTRIDKMQAELSKTQAELVKVRQDTTPAPIALAVTGAGAGAALFAAGAAFIKLIG